MSDNYKKGCLVFLILMTLVGCDKSRYKSQNRDLTEMNAQITENWFKYVDSIEIFRVNSQAVDSIAFYFMSHEAPMVIHKTHILFWKNGKTIENHQCVDEADGYFNISNDHYVVYIIGQRSIYLEEIVIHKSLECLNTKYLDFTPKDPCLEMYNLEKDALEENIVYLKATMNNICFHVLSDTCFTYELSN